MKPDAPDTLRAKIRRMLQLTRAVRFVWQSARGYALAHGALVAIQGVLPLLPMMLTKLLVDAVTAGVQSPDPRTALHRVLWLVLMLAAATLFMAFVRSLANLVGERQALLVEDHMNEVLLAKSTAVDLEYYESAQYYDSLHRAQREAPLRPVSIVNGLAHVAQDGIGLLAIAGLLWFLHWAIALVMLAAVGLGAALRLLQTGANYRWQRAHTATERQASYLNGILTDSSHAKEVRLLNLGPLFIRRFRDLRETLRRGRMALARRRSAADLVAQALSVLAIYGSYGYLAAQTIRGENTLGDLVMYFQAFQRVQGSLQGLLGSLSGLYSDSLFFANLYEFLDLKRTVAEPLEPKPVPRPMQTGIQMDHVSFQYPGSARQAIDDVSLTIRPGQVVAFVGENGSGKTTLIKLLCRLYDVSNGRISIDDNDLRTFASHALRAEIAVIFQDYARYHLSAEENIWLGNAEIPCNRANVIAAARRAGADHVIQKLPQGYDTLLGKWFADGEELSIGEWQKVALARAFMRDAQILVLDEPTSSMDAKAEYAIFQNFRDLVAGRTAIIISHRFSTVRMADRIFVMEQGRIIESGSHEDLLRAAGTYARLFDMQARHYR